MAQENTQPKKDEELTGSDIPSGDGTVSDEQMQAISGAGGDKPIGQDHSTENRAETMPEEIGAIQDDNDISSDVARIND